MFWSDTWRYEGRGGGDRGVEGGKGRRGQRGGGREGRDPLEWGRREGGRIQWEGGGEGERNGLIPFLHGFVIPCVNIVHS